MEFKQIWSNLDSDVRKEFEFHAKTFEFKRGDYVYRQGDMPKGIYFVEKGLVGLMLIGAQSGKEYLLRFFRQGQFFGHRSLFAEEAYHASTVVLEPTLLKLVPQKVITSNIEKKPKLLFDVVKVLSKELRRSEVQHVMVLENEILVRVAQSLVYLKDLHPDHNWTRQEIANFCGSTVSTVIKAMAQLEQMGYISQSGRAIELLNREALIQLQD